MVSQRQQQRQEVLVTVRNHAGGLLLQSTYTATNKPAMCCIPHADEVLGCALAGLTIPQTASPTCCLVDRWLWSKITRCLWFETTAGLIDIIQYTIQCIIEFICNAGHRTEACSGRQLSILEGCDFCVPSSSCDWQPNNRMMTLGMT